MYSIYTGLPWASLLDQMLKRLPAMQETRVQSLDREDPLEKEMTTRSSILAWRIPWTEEPGIEDEPFSLETICEPLNSQSGSWYKM